MNRAAAALLGATLLLAVVASILLLRPVPQQPLAHLDSLGGDFTLPGTLGHETSLADFRGRVVLLNFGFASCPDVCPTVLSRMRATLLALGDESDEVQALFVTIDPERDTLEKLSPYVRFFDPSFVALRGSEEQTRVIADRYKVYYRREAMPAPMEYGFSHSDHIYLIDRNGRVRATFSSGTTTEAMLRDIGSLLAERGSFLAGNTP